MGKCFSKSSRHKDDDPCTMSLAQFDLLRSVGRGAFGKVRVVRKKSDKKLFALKYINKQKCIAQRSVRNTIFERDLLEGLEHPLIVNLRYAFQDGENMFMVLDLMLGGDMKFHLGQTGTFPEEAVRLYAAEMVCSLGYLHGKGVAHRDVKPDNLLLDEQGHIHLTDFNVATFLPRDGSKLKSFSGTLTYMAPEVIKGDGYRAEIDWWSMGVVLFELLFGKRPFRGRTSRDVAMRICKGVLQFPNSQSISEDCYDFLTKLLKKKPQDRLGHGGVEEIKKHPFLANMNWPKIEAKEVQPIFVPDPKKLNFSAVFEAEDILMEENPLKRRRGRKSTMVTRSPEELLIEATFHTFDYRERAAALERRQEQGECLLRGAQGVGSEQSGEKPSLSSTADGETSELATSCSKLSLRSELLANEHAPDTDEDLGSS